MATGKKKTDKKKDTVTPKPRKKLISSDVTEVESEEDGMESEDTGRMARMRKEAAALRAHYRPTGLSAKELMNRLGLTLDPRRNEPKYTIYRIRRLERATLDRSKYPGMYDWEMFEPDKRVYGTWQEANKIATKLSLEDRKYSYFFVSQFVTLEEVPKKIREKVIEEYKKTHKNLVEPVI